MTADTRLSHSQSGREPNSDAANLKPQIVTTTTLALGSRYLSGKGAIVTRLSAIEEMAGMDMLCSDKTGTLTLNKMVIQDDCPVFCEGEDKDSVLFQVPKIGSIRLRI